MISIHDAHYTSIDWIYLGTSQWLPSGNSRNIIAILSTEDSNSEEISEEGSAVSSTSKVAAALSQTQLSTTTTSFRQAESLPLWSPVGGTPLPEIDILFHSDQVSSPMRLVEQKNVGRKGVNSSSARQQAELRSPFPQLPISSSSSRESRVSIAVPR